MHERILYTVHLSYVRMNVYEKMRERSWDGKTVY